MGTRSRVILRRGAKTPIYLWMHWDGYYSGQGNALAKSLVSLLRKYTPEDLLELVATLEVEYLPEDQSQNFSGEHLYAFILGDMKFYNDTCDDIEFEYIIDFEKQYLAAIPMNYSFGSILLRFDMLQDGYMPGDFQEFLE